MEKQMMIVAATMCLHNFIRENHAEDKHFLKCHCVPDYIPTICRGSVTAGSKFLGLRAGPRTVTQMGAHMIYTGSGLWRVTPYVQFVLLCYLC
jgi:hypothetical protein